MLYDDTAGWVRRAWWCACRRRPTSSTRVSTCSNSPPSPPASPSSSSENRPDQPPPLPPVSALCWRQAATAANPSSWPPLVAARWPGRRSRVRCLPSPAAGVLCRRPSAPVCTAQVADRSYPGWRKGRRRMSRLGKILVRGCVGLMIIFFFVVGTGKCFTVAPVRH